MKQRKKANRIKIFGATMLVMFFLIPVEKTRADENYVEYVENDEYFYTGQDDHEYLSGENGVDVGVDVDNFKYFDEEYISQGYFLDEEEESNTTDDAKGDLAWVGSGVWPEKPTYSPHETMEFCAEFKNKSSHPVQYKAQFFLHKTSNGQIVAKSLPQSGTIFSSQSIKYNALAYPPLFVGWEITHYRLRGRIETEGALLEKNGYVYVEE